MNDCLAKRATLLCVLILPLLRCSRSYGQYREDRTFELTAVGPPTPALKYQLQVDPADRRPGNAALFYLRAALLIDEKTGEQIVNAYDALSEGAAKFDSLAQPWVGDSSAVDFLRLAASREQCDWEPGIADRGFRASFPELNTMRSLGLMMCIRAAYQMRHENIDGAVESLRLGLALGRNLGQEPILVSGLVSFGITNAVDDRLSELMNRSDAPNLYWALASLPRPILRLSHSLEGERIFYVASIPLLAKAKSGDLSKEQWRSIFGQILEYDEENVAAAKKMPTLDEELKKNGDSMLPPAREHYATTHNLSPGDAAVVDSFKIMAAYYFDQYCAASDDMIKAANLPYPQMIKQMDDSDDRLKALAAQEPANVFLVLVPSLGKAAGTFARGDRTIDALTAVEAIRSYAAAHGGKLPAHLEDITETPAPVNPQTRKVFDYQVDGDAAHLSDLLGTKFPLDYTIRIRAAK